ncbi:MAG: MliC family protein [Asticcacaulis sp.]
MRKIAAAFALMAFSATALSACSKPEAEQAVEEAQSTVSELAGDAHDAMSSAAADFAVSDPIAYDCANGTRLSVIFSDGKADITILSDHDKKVSLTESPSGEGTLYTATGYSLHTKGNDATWGSTQEMCKKA